MDQEYTLSVAKPYGVPGHFTIFLYLICGPTQALLWYIFFLYVIVDGGWGVEPPPPPPEWSFFDELFFLQSSKKKLNGVLDEIYMEYFYHN